MKSLSFSAHPAEVGESYLQHLRHALGFALTLGWACIACTVHALLPFLFEKTGSQCICRLHERMVLHRKQRERRVSQDAASSTGHHHPADLSGAGEVASQP